MLPSLRRRALRRTSCVIIAALLSSTRLVADENAGAARPSYIEPSGGLPAIRLTPELRRQAGIETQRLHVVRHLPERHGHGRVIDVQPLLALRARYHRLRSEKAIHAAALSASQANYDRVRGLYQDQAVSTTRMEQARAQWQADRAQLEADRQQLRDIRDEARQAWGAVLSSWALDDPKRLAGLTSHRQVLLLITLPPNQQPPAALETIRIGRSGDRRTADTARWLSAAPYTDPAVQGESHFFISDAGQLRSGMRLDAWIPQTAHAISGVNLPLSSVVWHAGAPWAYVQIDKDRFARRRITQHEPFGELWFVTRDIEPGDVVIATGAQTLLSEEFRWRIPDEDDD